MNAKTAPDASDLKDAIACLKAYHRGDMQGLHVIMRNSDPAALLTCMFMAYDQLLTLAVVDPDGWFQLLTDQANRTEAGA